MKLLTKKNILLVFLATIMVFPLISVVALAAVPQSAQAERVSFVIGSGGNPGGAQLDDWDPAIVTTSNFQALETLVWANWKDRQVYPGLVENWTLHARADEGGNTGGVVAISFNLRKGVEFFDGSEFNASVVKWNWDRLLSITGINVAPNNRKASLHWFDPSSMASHFTQNWNLSWAINDPEVSLITTAVPGSITDGDYIKYTSKTATGVNDYYIWFDKTGDSSGDPAPGGRMEIYCNISTATTQKNVSDALGAAIGAITGISATNTPTNVTITNTVDGSVPDIADHNSGLAVSTLSQGIWRNPYNLGERIPVVNEIIVVSEHVVNFTLNKWATNMYYFLECPQISMEEYEDFATTYIRGYAGSGIDHLIGTGPYKFVYADFVVTSTQYSVKNENYWNKDFLEAQGLFVVDDVYTRWYATAESRSTALLAGDVDVSGWQAQSILTDMAALNASELHTIYPTEYDASYTTIQFSNRENNDAFVPYLGMSLRQFWPFWAAANGIPGQPIAQGVNKSVRQAISWAFNYDTYMAIQYESTGAIRADSPLGAECVWNDGTVPYPVYDITKAREILLSDPYYEAICTAKGLDINSADSEWTGIGLGLNPINTFTYLDGGTPNKVDHIGKALNDLGFGMTVNLTTSLDSEWMYTKKAMQFDMFSYIWPTGKLEPMEWMTWGMRLLYSSSFVAIPVAFNFAMLQNSSIDYLMNEIPWMGTAAQPAYNNLTAMLMEEAGHLYIAHAGRGAVVNSGWDVTHGALERGGGMNLAMQWVGGARSTTAPPAPPEIPGFSTLMVVLFGLVSIVGISYSIAKKRRKH